VLVALDNWF